MTFFMVPILYPYLFFEIHCMDFFFPQFFKIFIFFLLLNLDFIFIFF